METPYTQPNTTATGGTPAPYGRACANCSKAKCRCIYRSDGDGCERCHRLKKDCRPSTPVRRRAAASKKRTSSSLSRTAQLEQKLDGLVSLLTAHNSGSASQGHTGATAQSAASAPSSLDENAFQRVGNEVGNEIGDFGCGGVPKTASMSLREERGAGGPDGVAPPICHLPRTPESSVSSAAPTSTTAAAAAATTTTGGWLGPGWGINCFAGASPPSRLPTRPGYDKLNMDPAIEPSAAEAEESLRLFRTTMLPYFPFVHVPADTTAAEIRRERPIFWLAIMSVTCQRVPTQAQLARSTHIRMLFAQRIVFDSEKTLDLLLGLLTFMTWVHYTSKRDRPTLSVMSQLAVALVYDLGLHKTVTPCRSLISRLVRDQFHQPIPGGDDPPQPPTYLEDRRAALGCYMLTSGFAIALKRCEPLRWTIRMEEHLNELEANAECPLDHVLVAQVRLQRIADHINQGDWQLCDPSLPSVDAVTNNATGQRSQSENRLLPPYVVRILRAKIDEVKMNIPSEVRDYEAVLDSLYAVEMMLCAGAIMPVVAPVSSMATIAVVAARARINGRPTTQPAKARTSATAMPTPTSTTAPATAASAEGRSTSSTTTAAASIATTTSPTATTATTAVDFARVAALERCVEAVAAYWAFFRQIASGSYAGLPFAFYAHFTHCVVLLYGLSVIDEPHWDRAAVRDRLHVLDMLDGFIYKLRDAPRLAPVAVTGVETYDVFQRAAAMLSSVREHWAADTSRLPPPPLRAVRGGAETGTVGSGSGSSSHFAPDRSGAAEARAGARTTAPATTTSSLAPMPPARGPAEQAAAWPFNETGIAAEMQMNSAAAAAAATAAADASMEDPPPPEDAMLQMPISSDLLFPDLLSAMGLSEDFMFWDVFFPEGQDAAQQQGIM